MSANRVEISKVNYTLDGRVHVHPRGKAKALYQYVYRDATGVSWDEGLGCFGAKPTEEKSTSEGVNRIITAVRNELGITLYITLQSDLSGAPEFIQSELVAEL